jgi:hypothetical protein
VAASISSLAAAVAPSVRIEAATARTHMDSDAVTVGGLTIIGTTLATLAGLWQWRRVQAREQRAEFRVQRLVALKESTSTRHRGRPSP